MKQTTEFRPYVPKDVISHTEQHLRHLRGQLKGQKIGAEVYLDQRDTMLLQLESARRADDSFGRRIELKQRELGQLREQRKHKEIDGKTYMEKQAALAAEVQALRIAMGDKPPISEKPVAKHGVLRPGVETRI